jgi:hypothetical protein
LNRRLTHRWSVDILPRFEIFGIHVGSRRVLVTLGWFR